MTEAHRDGDKFLVFSAFRIYPSLIQRIDEVPPLEILKDFVENFGLPLNIGDQVKKFFVKEEIFMNNYRGGEIVKILDTNCSDFLSNFLIRIKDANERGAIAEVALAYCINVKEYKSYLDVQK